jgi:DNA-binding CsgD family transcriptional regulator
MFDGLFKDLIDRRAQFQERPDGVAFLKVANSVYGFSGLFYLGLNIPNKTRGNHFVHCAYSDRSVKQLVCTTNVSTSALVKLGLLDPGPLDWTKSEQLRRLLDETTDLAPNSRGELNALTFPLRTLSHETAIFGVVSTMSANEWDSFKATAVRDFHVLGSYFHSHILRMNGTDTAQELLISARELDCLKWTAAGKTAWEASVILGISERTVRFHLNAAREKMNCATTTQAVAKAVAHQLIWV